MKLPPKLPFCHTLRVLRYDACGASLSTSVRNFLSPFRDNPPVNVRANVTRQVERRSVKALELLDGTVRLVLASLNLEHVKSPLRALVWSVS